jgi:hypothetical protein
MNRQRRSAIICADEGEECTINVTPECCQPRRKLIDYTISNSHTNRKRSEWAVRQQNDLDSAATSRPLMLPPSPKSKKTTSTNESGRLDLPSFSYLEKIPYGSLHLADSVPTLASSLPEERVDFFLKVRTTRIKSDSNMLELRAGFRKQRLQKSRLFGSFSENGERRSSYADLKRVLSQGKDLNELNLKKL